jgi:hypothetical protein
MTDTIDDTLKDRGAKYGDFTQHAAIAQTLKDIMSGEMMLLNETAAVNEARKAKWREMSYDKREALEMIQHKVARILNGDPEFHDSWHDIVGYGKLAADRVKPR